MLIPCRLCITPFPIPRSHTLTPFPIPRFHTLVWEIQNKNLFLILYSGIYSNENWFWNHDKKEEFWKLMNWALPKIIVEDIIFSPIKPAGQQSRALRSLNLKSLMRFPSNTRELVRSKSSFAFSNYDFFALTWQQGGRTWQPIVGSKNCNENFRQTRIYNFRVKCVVFARNRKFAKLTRWNMQYILCNGARLAQDTLFLTQKGTFFAQRSPKSA